jgi:hypothetical protein
MPLHNRALLTYYSLVLLTAHIQPLPLPDHSLRGGSVPRMADAGGGPALQAPTNESNPRKRYWESTGPSAPSAPRVAPPGLAAAPPPAHLGPHAAPHAASTADQVLERIRAVSLRGAEGFGTQDSQSWTAAPFERHHESSTPRSTPTHPRPRPACPMAPSSPPWAPRPPPSPPPRPARRGRALRPAATPRKRSLSTTRRRGRASSSPSAPPRKTSRSAPTPS